MNARSLAAAVLSVTLIACSSESETAPTKSAAASAPPKAESAAATKTPAAAQDTAHSSAAALAFTAQPGWTTEKPTSSMRKAQYLLPRAEKDTEDATLVVFFFGGQGGSTQDNIDRWTQQFEQPDGGKSSAVLQNSMRTVNGMSVHDVDLSGTYVAETAPGSGQHLHKEGWRMMASIIEAKEGPYYAKLVGPADTVKHWESSFRNFVSETKPGK